MKVVFFHRKRYHGAYSIEILFDQLRKAMPKNIVALERQMRFVSKGFFKRLYISLESMLYQGDINHVTGDVHFITLFLRRRSTILTIHDIGFINHRHSLIRYLLKWFWLILPVKRCAAVTVVSAATKSELLRFFSKEMASKIHVIYNPIRQGFFYNEKSFDSNEPIILQIGTKHNKNFSRLIEALSQVKCKLEIVGHLSEENLSMLKFYRIAYAASEDLTDLEVIEKYKGCDIVSFVSTHEGFGLPIIEANAVGRVVVTSNVSSMPEIAGNAAHLVDPFDVVSIRNGFLKVIKDAKYREQLILNGFENIKRFDVKKIVSQYVDLYKSLENNI